MLRAFGCAFCVRLGKTHEISCLLILNMVVVVCRSVTTWGERRPKHRGCGWLVRAGKSSQGYLSQHRRQQRQLTEYTTKRNLIKPRKQRSSPSPTNTVEVCFEPAIPATQRTVQEEVPTTPPPERPESTWEAETPARYDLTVPMRGIDEWRLWEFLENMFGDENFSVRQQRYDLLISTPSPLNEARILGNCRFRARVWR